MKRSRRVAITVTSCGMIWWAATAATAYAQSAVCAGGWHSASALLAPHNARFNGANDSTCLRVQACVDFDMPVTLYADTVLVEGSLRFTDGANRTLNTRRLYVAGPTDALDDPAELIIGSEATPFQAAAKIALADRGVADCTHQVVIDPAGAVSVSLVDPAADPYHPDPLDPEAGKLPTRTLYAHGRVNLELHGRTRAATWNELLVPVGPTAVTPPPLTLRFPAAPTWTVGDQVVVVTTDFDLEQSERQTISAAPTKINPMFPFWQVPMSTLFAYQHHAGPVGDTAVAPVVVENAEVGLLTHNVTIFTPASDLGVPAAADVCNLPPALYFDGAEVRIERDDHGVPTFHLEQIEVFNAGKAGLLGHYPLHFHELGAIGGSYLRRSSVHDSSNHAVTMHAVQDLAVSDVVTFDVVGHAFYLEPAAESEYATRHNTLQHNLAVSTHGCQPDDPAAPQAPESLRGPEAAAFYFDDPRNVFWGNVAAGYDFHGFYFGLFEQQADVESPGEPLDCYHLCGDALIDYAVASSLPLDTDGSIYTHATYGAADYQHRLPPRATDPVACAGVTETACHGTFRWNVAHSGRFGLWAEEQKNTLIRINDFMTFKNEERGVGIKNHGITEVLRLRAGDNGTAFWPASHAYNLWRKPELLMLDGHVVGLSDNLGASTATRPWTATEIAAGRSLPSGGLVSIYGVEVYEGHMHVARSHFEDFPAMAPLDVAAFGRHQSFPFYSNDPDNSIQAVTIEAASNPLWFDPPSDQASGQQTVLLVDLDDSLGMGLNTTFAPRHDVVIPGAQCTAAMGACDPLVDPTHVVGGSSPTLTSWNAFAVDASVPYGQVIIEWCDDAQGCVHDGAPSGDDYSSWWQPLECALTVDGLEILDATEGHLLTARPSVQGTHNHLGGNLVLGHAYDVTFWANRNGPQPLLDVSPLSAIEIMLRRAPVGVTTCVSVPVSGAPDAVIFSRGELETDFRLDTATAVALPILAGDWNYDAVTGRVTGCLDAAADDEGATLTIIVRPSCSPFDPLCNFDGGACDVP